MRKLTLLPLMAAVYFMVAGGPYGLEELIHGAGFGGAVLVLLVTPLIWSLPTALMVSELSSAIPEDGGYYAWVRRALGPFWGFQEAWLSLAASIFDMAIYPTLFVAYLGRFCPSLGSGTPALLVGIGMIAVCVWLNVRGAASVGGSSVAMSVLLLAPFAVMAVFAAFHPPAAASAPIPLKAALAGIPIAMWNYMGWDNASTIAGEVHEPQRTYPRAMLGAVLLTAMTYVLPVLAAWRSGLPPSRWSTGSWVEAARAFGGPWLASAVVIGGMTCGLGMFNSLVLSYTRLPPALAEDGLLPRIFARRHPKTGAPWVAIIVCACAWGLCLRLGFERLVVLDVMLYGASLALEFAALVALRIREPGLPRPFRLPGGLPAAILIGLPPMALLALAFAGQAGDARGLRIGLALMAAGPVLYALNLLRARKA